jgi:hypothetical protein
MSDDERAFLFVRELGTNACRLGTIALIQSDSLGVLGRFELHGRLACRPLSRHHVLSVDLLANLHKLLSLNHQLCNCGAPEFALGSLLLVIVDGDDPLGAWYLELPVDVARPSHEPGVSRMIEDRV